MSEFVECHQKSTWREKLIALNTLENKSGFKSIISVSTFRTRKKKKINTSKVSRRKKIIIRVKKTKIRKQKHSLKPKVILREKSIKLKPFPKLIQKKRVVSNYNIMNEIGDIIKDSIAIKISIKKHND